nr:DUF3426 domain-containing protein [Pseudoxanthomonas sp.]
MFIACPHCRYLVATAPRGQDAPAHCPRCGGVLGDAGTRTGGQPATSPRDADAADGGPSLARLLRRDGTVDAAGPTGKMATDAAAREAGVTEAGVVEADVADPAASMDESHTPGSIAFDVEPTATMSESAADAATGPAAVDAPVGAPVPVASPAAAIPHRASARAPSFLQGSARAPAASTRVPGWQWITLGVLAVTLALQVMLADRARLAADAGWRPALTTLCNALGCSLPPWREPQAFAMLDRDVRPVPGAPGVLLAQATFRNDARWSQPWPVLVLTLRDADGRTLGARAMRPAEYLPRDSAASTTLGPGQSAQVAVRVREPSANVVAFSFDFR